MILINLVILIIVAPLYYLVTYFLGFNFVERPVRPITFLVAVGSLPYLFIVTPLITAIISKRIERKLGAEETKKFNEASELLLRLFLIIFAIASVIYYKDEILLVLPVIASFLFSVHGLLLLI